MPGQSFRGFAERVALVTGGAHGTNRAVALQLAYEGAYVIVSHSPTDDASASIVRELRDLGTLAHSFAADVSRASDVENLFAGIEEMYGRLDLLVNGAALESAAPLTELSEERWDELLNVNLKSAFLCTRAAARLMKGRPKPAIVNLATDVSGSLAGCGAASVAAQSAIIGLSRAAAVELGPKIRVNCVAVRGASVNQSSGSQASSVFADFQRAEFSGANPPEPDEVARACIYLLSSDAARITGQTLIVGS